MSMTSAQVDRLRETADKLQDHATFAGFGGTQNTDPMALEAATLMRDAADTIWELRNMLSGTIDMRERLAEAENKRLREMARRLVYATHPLDRETLLVQVVEMGIEAD